MRETIYYQRGMPDPVLKDDIVIGLVCKYVPDAKKVTAVDDSHGEARAYFVDENIVLKVQRPQQLRSSTSLEKEAFFLKHLENTDVSVPRVLGYDKDGSLEYICMTRMPGVAVEHIPLTRQEKSLLLLKLGNELRKIHSVEQISIKKSGLFPEDDFPDLKERLLRRYQAVINRKANALPSDRITFALKQLKEAVDTINETDTFVALHVNPYIPHVFVDERTHRYTGIIDFGDSCGSTPSCQRLVPRKVISISLVM